MSEVEDRTLLVVRENGGRFSFLIQDKKKVMVAGGRKNKSVPAFSGQS